MKTNGIPRRLLPAAMLEHWTHNCRVKITLKLVLSIYFVSTKTEFN